MQSATETTGEAQTWKQTFIIDRYGNRRFDAANTTTLGSCLQKTCNPVVNTSDNRFQEDQDGDTLVDYDYDANGAVIKDASGQRFTYDAESHQKEFFVAGNGTSTPDATYQYDGDGRRVKKITNSETTIFVYNASGQLVAEYSTALATTPQVSYLTTDHLGSPRVVTDKNGVVKDRKDYSAFGEESISAQRSANTEYSAADQLRKNYTGYEKDGESGLEFAQARYYNPTHGRFTSVDPLTASASIRNPQTFNRYSYVLNSPYKFTDPLGLKPAAISDKSSNWKRDLWRWSVFWSIVYGIEGRYDQNGGVVPDEAILSPANSSRQATVPPDYGKPGGDSASTVDGNAQSQDTFFELLWALHAGPGAAYVDPTTGKPPKGFEHQCSINMAAALQRAGIDMSSYAGKTVKASVGNATMKLATGADDLANWLTHIFIKDERALGSWGMRNRNWNRALTGTTDEFLNAIAGQRGIVIALDSWKDSATGRIGGHIDLWNGQRMRRESYSNGLLRKGRELYFIRLQ